MYGKLLTLMGVFFPVRNNQNLRRVSPEGEQDYAQ
jgi:hypothetical protein